MAAPVLVMSFFLSLSLSLPTTHTLSRHAFIFLSPSLIFAFQLVQLRKGLHSHCRESSDCRFCYLATSLLPPNIFFQGTSACFGILTTCILAFVTSPYIVSLYLTQTVSESKKGKENEGKEMVAVTYNWYLQKVETKLNLEDIQPICLFSDSTFLRPFF